MRNLTIYMDGFQYSTKISEKIRVLLKRKERGRLIGWNLVGNYGNKWTI